MLLWVGFILCSAVIVYSGTKLSRYGDILAEKTGLGRTWIGVVMVATVTSLPELVTGISSVTFADVPDIAVGNVLGACVLNMLMLALMDLIHKTGPVSSKAHQGNVLSAGFGIILLSLVCLSLTFSEKITPLGWIGPYSIVIVVFYFIAMKIIYSYEKRKIAAFMKDVAEEIRYEKISKKSAFIGYIAHGLTVVVAAMFLPEIGAEIAESTGLGQTFVGAIFIAISTTMPEAVVSFTAVKMDAVDLAVGNLFGSVIFNIFILAIDDMFFVKGPLLSYVSANHIVSGLSAITMTAIAITGLTYHSEKKRLFLAWDSIGIILVYVLNLMLIYTLR